MFHALVHGLVPCGGLRFHVTLKDVEALNQVARHGRYATTKLSFAALAHLQDRYLLMRSGAAMGRGCGPLLLRRPSAEQQRLAGATIAVPGRWTTANLLLALYLRQPPRIAPMTFDRIMPALAAGAFDFGVIIHEGRFTYGSHGLIRVADLGEWWENETGLPIPLGGIAARRDLDPGIAAAMEEGIRDSVAFARRDPAVSRGYVKQHAQEMDDSVIDRHIDLYVNRYSVELGGEGEEAVRALFSRARKLGLGASGNQPLFYGKE
jgi:1,4-dihydroxy-6-naphthoate synthase